MMYEVIGSFSGIRDYQEHIEDKVLGLFEADNYKDAINKALAVDTIHKMWKQSNCEAIFANQVYEFEVSFVLDDEELDEEPEMYSVIVWAENEDKAALIVERRHAGEYDFQGIWSVERR